MHNPWIFLALQITAGLNWRFAHGLKALLNLARIHWDRTCVYATDINLADADVTTTKPINKVDMGLKG
jgi:hypothetical protein